MVVNTAIAIQRDRFQAWNDQRTKKTLKPRIDVEADVVVKLLRVAVLSIALLAHGLLAQIILQFDLMKVGCYVSS
jgi:hypothetical protein